MLLDEAVHAVDEGLTLNHAHGNFSQRGINRHALGQCEVHRCGIDAQSLAEVRTEEVHRSDQLASRGTHDGDLVFCTVQQNGVLLTHAPAQEHHGALVHHDLTWSAA